MKSHLVQLAQQIVRELQVRLVDLVDEHDHRVGRREGLTEHAHLDVAPDLPDISLAEARVVQARHHVIGVQALLGDRRGLDVPGEQRLAERLGDGVGELRLSRARLTADQQRAPQRDGGVHVGEEIGVRDVLSRAGETFEGGQDALLCGPRR